jgi:ribosomal protein S18 acetylase RimI-like enzyme
MIRIRRASPEDLPALEAVEERCFDAARRDAPRVLRASLGNSRHEVWVLEEGGAPLLGALFLRFRRKSLRVYSIAVVPEAQGRGLGSRLMEKALARARARDLAALTLEAAAGDDALLAWYERFGFRRRTLLPDYYGPGRPGLRLRRRLDT